MSVLDRAMLALFALLAVAFAVALMAVAAGWTVPLHAFTTGLQDSKFRLVTGLVAFLFLLVSLRFLLISLRTSTAHEEPAIISSEELGVVSISPHALEELVNKAARQVKGVREVKPHLKIIPGGLVVKLDINVSPDRNIQEMTTNLQNRVHDYIVTTTGLDVPEIQVKVKGIYQEGLRRVE